MADGYVLFVWKTTGYELEQREGDPPDLGAEVEVDGSTQVVVKVGASPLPGDRRPGIFLGSR